MANTKKYVSLDKLGLYDEKIKDVISAGDAAALKDAKDYADGLAVNYDAAGAANTALESAKAYADGKDAAIAEAKKAGTDAAAAAGVADGKAVAAQTDVDNLEAYVGTFTASEGVDTVVKYIDAKTANIASDETVGALADRVTQAEKDIDAIEADYLKAADKTELDGKITTAQTAADSAQDYAEGVAGDLATETSERKAADEAQVERIAALEGTIVGLSGAMHFEGVKDALPENTTGYEQGDVIIVGNKEYVANGDKFVEFGDASVNAEAITELTGRVSTAEGKITTAEGKITTLEGAVATKAEKTYVDEQVEALEGIDTGLDNRLKAVEAKFGGAEGSVEDMIADAKAEAISEATSAAATDAKNKADAAEKNAKDYADGLNTTMSARVDALEAIDHDHSNKAELDLIATGDKAKWDDAAAIAHEHGNKTVLDGITAENITTWNTVTSKAAQSDLTAVSDRVTTLETWHTNFTEVSEEEINALFQ